MLRFFYALSASAIAIGTLVGTGVATSDTQLAQTSTPETFPDVRSDYWAHPFIQILNQKDIIAGYPDGTFKPQQAVDRDEFAVMIRQGFEKDKLKAIPSGSVFADVPQNYWAASPIEEAYETGFMQGYPDNSFKPQQEITKVEGLVSLARGLDLNYEDSTAPTPPVQENSRVSSPRKQTRRVARNRIAFPLAMTALMQPFIQPVSAQERQPTRSSPAQATHSQDEPSARSAREFLSEYYQDADQIPEYAIDEIAAATQAGIVVNHPALRMLNPDQLLDRGTASALIHQALVRQDKLERLPENSGVDRYIVDFSQKREGE